MTDRAAHEFTVLRDTIRARGGTRPLAFLGGLIAWAALLIVVVVWLPLPLASLIPLLVLLSTFEVVRTLHLGVERIGRYLQVFHEESDDARLTARTPAWETTACSRMRRRKARNKPRTLRARRSRRCASASDASRSNQRGAIDLACTTNIGSAPEASSSAASSS